MIITVAITDEEERILKNDLLDIEDWVNLAIAGKVNNCKKRMIREWRETLKSRYDNLPTADSDMLARIFAEADYQDRITRDKDNVI